MRLVWSKEVIADDILPFIHNYMMINNIDTYIEPFVGGANIIDKVVASKKYGYDKNKYIIAFLNYIKSGGKIPENISIEQYLDCKAHYKANDTEYTDWFTGAVAILADVRGKFFDKHSRTSGIIDEEKYNKHYKEAVKEITEQSKFIHDINFINAEYKDIQAENSLIYCEIPDNIRTERFDTVDFWITVSKWNKSNNIVLIRSESAPDEYDVIWENEDKSKKDRVYIHREVNIDRKIKADYEF